MRWSALLLVTFCNFAHAMGGGYWINVDYTYSDITYKEPAFSEIGHMPGIRGEFGFGVSEGFALLFNGEYRDGNLNADGTTLTGGAIHQITGDYFRDTRLMIQMAGSNAVYAAGVANREWYDHPATSYRRRETFAYYPITATFYRENLYFKIEYDFLTKGHNKSYMSDTGGGASDVEFAQTSGSGYGVEVGYIITNADKFATRLFMGYSRWDIGDSDTQSDGVSNLTLPKNNMVTLQAGLGLSF